MKYALRCLTGKRAGEVFAVSGEITGLGRSSRNAIAIADPLLSRDHCQFELRGGELWLTDLASVNQTFVNGKAVDSVKLEVGSTVAAGDSTLVVELQSAIPVPAESAGLSDCAIDLGFNVEPADHRDNRKQLVRGVIALLGAVAVLAVGFFVIMQSDLLVPVAGDEKAVVEQQDESFEIFYEKAEVSLDKSLRIEISLNTNGELALRMNETGEKPRSFRREKLASEDSVRQLKKDIRNGGFYRLQPEYTGNVLSADRHAEYTLTVIDGRRVYRCRVLNTVVPLGFEKVQTIIDAFANTEIGTWSIQLSGEELLKNAQRCYAEGQRFETEQELARGNLWGAIKSYKDGLFYAESLDPKPEFYQDMRNRMEKVGELLDQRCREQNVQADRAVGLKNWGEAQAAYQIICEMVPDRSDDRYGKAAQRLVYIETQMRGIRNKKAK